MGVFASSSEPVICPIARKSSQPASKPLSQQATPTLKARYSARTMRSETPFSWRATSSAHLAILSIQLLRSTSTRLIALRPWVSHPSNLQHHDLTPVDSCIPTHCPRHLQGHPGKPYFRQHLHSDIGAVGKSRHEGLSFYTLTHSPSASHSEFIPADHRDVLQVHRSGSCLRRWCHECTRKFLGSLERWSNTVRLTNRRSSLSHSLLTASLSRCNEKIC
jgi:hypothetical protein